VLGAAKSLRLKDERMNEPVVALVRSDDNYKHGLSLLQFTTLTCSQQLSMLIDDLPSSETGELGASKAQQDQKNSAFYSYARSLVRGRVDGVSWTTDEMVEFFETRLAKDDVQAMVIRLVDSLGKYQVTFLPRLVQLAQRATRDEARETALSLAASIVVKKEDEIAELAAAQVRAQQLREMQEARAMRAARIQAAAEAAATGGDDVVDEGEPGVPIGALEGVEIDERVLSYAKRIIGRYDKNKDGRLTPAESATMLMKPKNADLDRDGAISVVEYAYSLAVRRKK